MTPFISRRPPGEIIEDFPGLKDEALGWLSQWCGDQWTDFNLSDPGVQILEQICYALTELAYRSRLPVETILQDRHGRINWEHGAFFPPPQILPMEPLTAADCRKFLLDRLEAVYQVWLAAPVNGRHPVWLYLHPDLDETGRAAVLQRAAELLDQHRNLGESFLVQAAPVAVFTLEATMALAPGHAPDEVLAALYTAVHQATAARPGFVSIADRQKAGDTLAAMFTGPLLEHGTMPDDGLPPPLSWEELQPLALARAAGIEGGVLERAAFAILDPAPAGDIPPAFIFSASFEAGAPGANRVTFTNGGSFPPANDARILALSRSLGAGPAPLSTKLLRGADWTMPRPDPAWSHAAVRRYHSVQREFPPNYALGPGEEPVDATPQRRAQIRQLRGYLLHFEQIMANYLEQLGHLPALLSSQPQTHTYFARPLYGVPEVLPLLRGFIEPESRHSPREAAERGAAYRRNTNNPYRHGLRSLTDNPGEFLSRRQGFLDHLLARFAESYPQASGPTYETIRNKESLLSALPGLGRRRAQESGLEEKIRLLLRRDRAGGRQDDPPEQKFYYLIEHGPLVRALPGPPDAGVMASQAFQLTHVLINWTVNALDAPFQDYVEAIILENVGAHLVSQFYWFESGRSPAGVEPDQDLATFLALHAVWRAAIGQPEERTAAANLFAWVQQPTAAAVAGPPPANPGGAS